MKLEIVRFNSDLASSTQPDSSDSSDEEISKEAHTGPSDSSETSEDDMPGKLVMSLLTL